LEGVDRRRDELVHNLSTLVKIPSVVGNEGRGQEAISRLYEEAGLEVVRVQPDYDRIKNHEAFIESNLPPENRPNIIGIKQGESSSKSLILNGHIDVVSPEPLNQWTHDPWGAEIVDGKLYGRGSGDMKGGLTANFMALKTLLELGLNPKGKVMLQSVIEEEAGGGLGTLACLHAGYTSDGMVITEPHNLKITVAMAGVNYFRVKVFGKTAHAGLAHQGVNAIGKMVPIYQALVDLDARRGEKIKFDLFEKGSGRSTHLNIGTLKAGDWASTVPGSAELECRISFIPGETFQEIKSLVEDTLFRAVQHDPWMVEHPPAIEWYGWHAEPWLQDIHAPFVQTFKETGEGVLGKEMEFIGRAAGLDARFASYFDMPSLCTGPVAERIHGLDECVDLQSLMDLTKILALFILNWCGLER
jgi:acetylornithine deacetylase